MVGVGEPGPGAANCAGIGIGRHAEGFVPAEADLFEQDLDGLGRGVLQEDRQGRALRSFASTPAEPWLRRATRPGTSC